MVVEYGPVCCVEDSVVVDPTAPAPSTTLPGHPRPVAPAVPSKRPLARSRGTPQLARNWPLVLSPFIARPASRCQWVLPFP